MEEELVQQARDIANSDKDVKTKAAEIKTLKEGASPQQKREIDTILEEMGEVGGRRHKKSRSRNTKKGGRRHKKSNGKATRRR